MVFLTSLTAVVIAAKAVKGSIISSSRATEDTTPAAGQVTMTT
jgi:hypothetical protein